MRSEAQLPQNILRSQGLTPDDISLVLVTPLQAYATANIHMFRNADDRHFPAGMDRGLPGAVLPSSRSPRTCASRPT